MATLNDILPSTQSAVQPPTPARATLGSILSPIQQPFANTNAGIALNTVKGLPSAALDVGKSILNFGKGAVQSLTQSAGRIPVDINADINQAFGTNLKTTAQIDETKHPVLAKAFKTFFGTDKIQNTLDEAKQNVEGIQNSAFAKSIGADKHALPLALAGVIGGDAINLLPFGGSEKNAAKQLLKVTTEEDAAKILKAMNIPDEVVKVFAPHFAGTKTLKETEDALTLMKGTMSLKQIEPEVKSLTQEGASNISPELQPLAQEAQKYKSAEEFVRAMRTFDTQKAGMDADVIRNTIFKDVKMGDGEAGVVKAITDFYNKVKGGEGSNIPPTVGKLAAGAADEGAKKTALINLDRINVGDQGAGKLLSTIEDIRPTLEEAKGAPLTHAEVLRAAQDASILTKTVSREATLKQEAALLATRQNLASMAEEKGVSSDFIDQLKVVLSHGTELGRKLEALKVGADPIAGSSKADIVKRLLNANVEIGKIVEASKGVDFNNLKEVTQFYRTFIKPTKTEWLNEYRYINLLSSPKTHVVNAFSNLIQGTLLNPATRLATGALDAIHAGLTGSERQVYAKEVAPYFKGFLNAVPNASKSFFEALKGNIRIERPDINAIPTGSKYLKPFQLVPRMLEASDVFFRTLVTEGERQAIAARYTAQGKELTDAALAAIEKEAQAKGEYYVFRQALDGKNKTGQGHVLATIDKITTAVYTLRKVPGVKWFIPFVQTPMNILKQGIEYSPLGIATLPGAANKTEQLAKTMIGSVVFLGAGSLGAQGRLTWAAPTNDKEKDAFYNSGRQPYSVKVGDTWVSFSKLGPLAYPLAMAAAMQWYTHENPHAVVESSFERAANAFQGIAQFFSDQSYMQGMKSLIDFSSGASRLTGIQSVVASNVEQVIPLASLQRFVAHIIDPVYRQPAKGFNLKNLVQSIEKDIPGLSTNVPKLPGAKGRPYPLLNAVSPLPITPIDQSAENKLQQIHRQQRQNARIKAIQDRVNIN